MPLNPSLPSPSLDLDRTIQASPRVSPKHWRRQVGRITQRVSTSRPRRRSLCRWILLSVSPLLRARAHCLPLFLLSSVSCPRRSTLLPPPPPPPCSDGAEWIPVRRRVRYCTRSPPDLLLTGDAARMRCCSTLSNGRQDTHRPRPPVPRRPVHHPRTHLPCAPPHVVLTHRQESRPPGRCREAQEVRHRLRRGELQQPRPCLLFRRQPRSHPPWKRDQSLHQGKKPATPSSNWIWICFVSS
jgi:hypothetical protein